MKKVIFPTISLFTCLLIYFAYYAIIPLPVYVAEKIEYLQQSQEEEITPLLFTGDIMLGRYVETLQNKQKLDPFGNTIEFLKSHITIANLEGPIPMIHKPTPSNGFAFSFPPSTPKYLKEHGIRAVSLSNNHSLDQGIGGYENTKLVLENMGISHFGGYDSNELDYFETKLGTTKVIVFGINMISTKWNEQAVHNFTKFLRQKYPSVYIVSFIHWGNEYDLKQGDIQQQLAHKLIDEGVNVIIGSHPHVIQGIEVYNNAPIFYSLGNFIFDQYFSEETQEGYMVSIDKQKNNFIFGIIPIISKESETNLADEKVSIKIRNVIIKSSQQNLRKNIEEGQIILPIL